MITARDILADMHTHTIFSIHANSTIKENRDAAEKAGMKYIAITDHFYGDGSELNQKQEANRIAYLENRVNSLNNKVYIIGGAEFNLNQEMLLWNKVKKINWRMIGLHSWFVDRENTTLNDIYGMFTEHADKYNAFAHIERELHKLDHGRHGDKPDSHIKNFLEKIVVFAKENNIFLEVNESTLINKEGGSDIRLEYWLKAAKENKNKISLGTDAHYCDEVGRFDNSINLLNRIGYEKEFILNCNDDMIKELLK